MNFLGVLCVILGLILIIFRAPLFFAPYPMLKFIQGIVNKKSSLRAVGVFSAILGLAFVLAATWSDKTGAVFFQGLGWILIVAAILEIVFTAPVQKIAVRVWNMKIYTARLIGLVSVIFGILLILLGLTVY